MASTEGCERKSRDGRYTNDGTRRLIPLYNRIWHGALRIGYVATHIRDACDAISMRRVCARLARSAHIDDGITTRSYPALPVRYNIREIKSPPCTYILSTRNALGRRSVFIGRLRFPVSGYDGAVDFSLRHPRRTSPVRRVLVVPTKISQYTSVR